MAEKNGLKYILKNVAMNPEMISRQAMESGIDISHVAESEQELKFKAEKEVFATRLMQLLAPGHVSSEIFVVKGVDEKGKNTYSVASKFIENYRSLTNITGSNGKRPFSTDGQGHTRLKISPNEHIYANGRMIVQLALNAISETDDNTENIGVQIKPHNSSKDNKFPIISIDHELALTYAPSFRKSFRIGKLLVSGNFRSVFENLQMQDPIDTPENTARIRKIRMDSINHIASVFLEGQQIYDAFNKTFSRDYGGGHKQLIQNIAENLKIKGASFLIANRLAKEGWDGIDQEAAKNIFIKLYGEDYKRLQKNHDELWEKERSLEGKQPQPQPTVQDLQTQQEIQKQQRKQNDDTARNNKERQQNQQPTHINRPHVQQVKVAAHGRG